MTDKFKAWLTGKPLGVLKQSETHSLLDEARSELLAKGKTMKTAAPQNTITTQGKAKELLSSAHGELMDAGVFVAQASAAMAKTKAGGMITTTQPHKIFNKATAPPPKPITHAAGIPIRGSAATSTATAPRPAVTVAPVKATLPQGPALTTAAQFGTPPLRMEHAEFQKLTPADKMRFSKSGGKIV